MGFDTEKKVLDIYVDIDDTICKTNGMNYADATPMLENIEKINKLYDQGHNITYWTARGVKTGLQWREVTENQLKEWGAKYHELHLTKLPFDVLIDDKAINTRDFEKGTWIK